MLSIVHIGVGCWALPLLGNVGRREFDCVNGKEKEMCLRYDKYGTVKFSTIPTTAEL